MCMVSEPSTPAPSAPPETLDQAAPDKKTANKRDANRLAIGTKRYRNTSGLGPTTTTPIKPNL